MIVTTDTGSRYEVTETTLRRLNVGERSGPLHKDDETLTVVNWIVRPEPGRSMVAMLTGVNDDPNIATLRRTSVVLAIEEQLQTPEEWCEQLGARVMDADGWRGRDGRSWDDPLSREEFDRRLSACTLDGTGYPMYIGQPQQRCAWCQLELRYCSHGVDGPKVGEL